MATADSTQIGALFDSANAQVVELQAKLTAKDATIRSFV